MATQETPQTSTRKDFPYIEPEFTSERWRDGIFDVESMIKLDKNNLFIKEDDLMTVSQREERELRKLIFEYQISYAEREYKLLQDEFKAIEERLRREHPSAEPIDHPFKEPAAPSDKKPRKKAQTTTKQSTSGSETEDKERSSARKLRNTKK